MIKYHKYGAKLNDVELADGFFEGWPKHPDKVTHRRILQQSFSAFVAIDEETSQIVGFINVISDGVLSAYIPLLEVIPTYQKQGIGTKLLELAIDEMDQFYMLDLVCDDDKISFYESEGMRRGNAMMQRNYERQEGLK